MIRLARLSALCLAASFVAAPASAGETSATLAPLFRASGGWLNGTVTPESLKGKVVLVDVFTFDCYNCKNVTPNLRALNRAGEVAIVGIHSPETPYERDRANVVANLKTLGVVWPVALDNSFTLWRAYNVEYWPTQLLFDRHGRLRKTIVGDSQDQEVDATLKALLAER
ncbi:MAG TPA: redoxin family protein [Candidatus Baltobacteraceae bacterium]|nr:redoxin family protein [Candidatus Baltobacteraceae bacterium]